MACARMSHPPPARRRSTAPSPWRPPTSPGSLPALATAATSPRRSRTVPTALPPTALVAVVVMSTTTTTAAPRRCCHCCRWSRRAGGMLLLLLVLVMGLLLVTGGRAPPAPQSEAARGTRARPGRCCHCRGLVVVGYCYCRHSIALLPLAFCCCRRPLPPLPLPVRTQPMVVGVFSEARGGAWRPPPVAAAPRPAAARAPACRCWPGS